MACPPSVAGVGWQEQQPPWVLRFQAGDMLGRSTEGRTSCVYFFILKNVLPWMFHEQVQHMRKGKLGGSMATEGLSCSCKHTMEQLTDPQRGRCGSSGKSAMQTPGPKGR
jgi:hypothetical protein